MKRTLALGLSLVFMGCGAGYDGDLADDGAYDEYDDYAADEDDLGVTQNAATISKPGNIYVSQFGTLDTTYAELDRYSSCTTSTVSGCQLEVCKEPPPTATEPHAGKITVKGDKLTVTLTPGADGRYNSGGSFYGISTPGTQVRATAPGTSKIGAFDLRIRSPQRFFATYPTTTISFVPRNKNLVFKWQAPITDPVRAEFEVLRPAASGNTMTYLRCTATEPTRLVVPAAAMSKLTPGSAFLRLQSEKVRSATIGDRRISLRVRRYADATTAFSSSSITLL